MRLTCASLWYKLPFVFVPGKGGGEFMKRPVFPPHSLFRVSIAALALAAAYLVWLSSPFGYLATFEFERWAWLPTRTLSKVAMWGMCALSLVLAWRVPHQQSARWLAIFLTLLAFALGALWIPSDSAFPVLARRVLRRLALVCTPAAGAALLLFSLHFPVTLRPEALRKLINSREVTKGYGPLFLQKVSLSLRTLVRRIPTLARFDSALGDPEITIVEKLT